MISPIFSSYEEIPWQASSEGDGLQVVSGSTHQEKARENSEEGPGDELVPGFEPDHIYQRESLVGIYVEDIVSALHIQLPDASSKHFVSFKSLFSLAFVPPMKMIKTLQEA